MTSENIDLGLIVVVTVLAQVKINWYYYVRGNKQKLKIKSPDVDMSSVTKYWHVGHRPPNIYYLIA